jgi:hydroxyacylglutathione hydrolase
MKVHQIFTNSPLRNFIYLIEDDSDGVYCLDPYDAAIVRNALKKINKKLVAIINTHEHFDHIGGNEELKAETGCEIYCHENGIEKIPGATKVLREGDIIPIAGGELKVLNTPGHTFAHLSFLLQENGKNKAIFSGDTLFNAGVGHCRLGGTAEILYETIQKYFQNLDDEVILYPGHDYLENNLNFTLDREPTNKIAEDFLSELESIDTTKVVTNMKREREVNTFLRLTEKEIINNLEGDTSSKKQVFIRLRELRDKW